MIGSEYGYACANTHVLTDVGLCACWQANLHVLAQQHVCVHVRVCHPLQNHYMHETIIFELFRGLQVQLQRSFESMYITVAVSLLFSQNAVAEIIPLRNFQELYATTVT